MRDHPHSQPPELKMRYPLPIVSGFGIAVAVLIALPVSQIIADYEKPPISVVQPPTINSPALMEIPEPPEVEPEEPDIEEIEETVEPPPMGFIDIANGVNLDNLPGDGWVVQVQDWRAIDDIREYLIDELTREPRPVRQMEPPYPPTERASKIEGEVVLSFVVKPDGSVTKVKVLSSTHRSFAQSAVNTVRRWEFEPGEKDGKAVHTRVRIRIPFRIH